MLFCLQSLFEKKNNSLISIQKYGCGIILTNTYIKIVKRDIICFKKILKVFLLIFYFEHT